tara:strand:+ start:507 stop:1151 length:645 start_codon:yes stop_codon:yes gene_type:complete
MFYQTALFVILRTFVQIVCDDYKSNSNICESLFDKAVAETIPEIRSAYFLKVMEADNKAVAKTFANYHISFLASNTTYASETEIIANACKMPYVTREFLSWTAGILPLFSVWVVYLVVKKISCKKNVVQIHEETQQNEDQNENQHDDEILDRPPMTPPLYVGIPEKEKLRNMGIRRRKDRTKERKQLVKPSVMEKITALSPALKNRIMNNDPMV